MARLPLALTVLLVLGTASNLSAVSALVAGPAQRPLSDASVRYTFPPNGGFSAILEGSATSVNVGYLRLQPDGQASPSGTALFAFRQNGTLVTEAAVPASQSILSGRIFAEISEPLNTGIAIANPNAAPATISFFFTDRTGRRLSSGTTVLAAGAQMARFLSEAPFNGVAPFNGTFTFASSVAISAVALRGRTNERSEFLITALPVADLSARSTGPVIFPHFADGEGWTTQVLLTNPTDNTITGTVQFWSSGSPAGPGEPLSVAADSGTSTTFSYDISPGSAWKLTTSGFSLPLRAGSVRVTPANGGTAPIGLTVHSFKQNGVTVTETGFASANAGTAYRVYAEVSGVLGSRNSVQTGLAVANLSTTEAIVSLELTDLSGGVVRTGGQISIPANGQRPLFLTQLPGFGSLPSPFQGVLRLTTSSNQISVESLRGRVNERGEFLIAAIPAVNEAEPAAGTQVFPHIVVGGGYSTQVVLFGRAGSQSSAGSLDSVSPSGALPRFTVRGPGAFGMDFPPEITSIAPSTPLQIGRSYPTGSVVRFDVASPQLADVIDATIRIVSASTGYDSGIRKMSFGSLFYLWDTSGLTPANDFVVAISLSTAQGLTSTNNTSTVSLTFRPPVINKLVSDLDLSSPADGLPMRFVRTYLLDSNAQGPLGYGWTHSYRMGVVVIPYFTKGVVGTLVPLQPAVQVFNADGTGSYFLPTGNGNYQSPVGDFRTLKSLPNGTYELTTKFGVRSIFSAAGILTQIVDPAGQAVRMNYDASGRLVRIQDASGQFTTLRYDANNRIDRVTDPAGQFVAYTYDSAGNLSSVSSMGVSTTRYTYDSLHNLTTITDPLGKRTFFTADSQDRLQEFSGENGGNRITFSYGVPAANQMTVTDALSNATVLTFDANSSVTTIVDTSGNRTSLTYDAQLNVTSTTDAAGNISRFTYDNAGNLLTAVDAHGRSVTLSYQNAFNQIVSLTDGNGRTTGFAYDSAGRLIRTTYPNGSAEALTYDAAGNVASRTDRKGQTITLSYDTSGRPLRRTFPDGTMHVFEYDNFGNLTVATDTTGSTRFSYDALGRVTEVKYPGGESVGYAYDDAGNRVQLTYPGGIVLRYSYDLMNRLAGILEGSSTIASYSYDALSRVQRRTLQNGTSAVYTYDRAGLLTSLLNRTASNALISSFDYTYDALGNILSMTTIEGRTNYVHDSIGQLIRVTRPDGSTSNYDYDFAGNRRSVINNAVATAYAANNLNQYTTVGGTTYTYDPNGNLASKTDSSGTTTYSYDFDDQLVRVSTAAETIIYRYDPFGRRTSKTSMAGTTAYIYDWDHVIQEKIGGSRTNYYIHGHDVDEILAVRIIDQNYYYAHDALGSVTELTNAAGGIVEANGFDEYGRIIRRTSSVSNTYLFTGREFDFETRLYNYRARLYDPAVGRFLSPDPIGIFGGVNLYTYAGNDPVDNVDPFGLKEFHIPLPRNWHIGLGGKYGSHIAKRTGMVTKHWYFEWTKFRMRIIYSLKHLERPGSRIAVPIYRNLRLPSWVLRLGPLTTLLWDFVFPESLGETPEELAELDSGSSTTPGVPPCTVPGGCMQADPTFVQPPAEATAKSAPVVDRNGRVVARILSPLQSSMVRGRVPIFGEAGGKQFSSYRLEYGEGTDPTEWKLIRSGDTLPDPISAPAATESSDASIEGNLGTWDTGLASYVYLPTFPRNHPINLKGTYTLRLIVNGHDSSVAEDRLTLTVADVITNAFGGSATTLNRDFVLTVPEQSIASAFQLVALDKMVDLPMDQPPDRVKGGPVYKVSTASRTFTKPALLQLPIPAGTRDTALSVYGSNVRSGPWELIPSTTTATGVLQAEVRTLHSFYSVMGKDGHAEQSVAQYRPQPSPASKPASIAGGNLLVRDTFEDGVGQWSNYADDAGGDLALDNSVTGNGTYALKITKRSANGNFAVRMPGTPFDVRAFPDIQFDYRIGPDVKTNILVKVSGRWYDIGFTDDPKDLKWKRVNITHIGRIADIRADNQWHTARFDLRGMLRTVTANTTVDEMIMADWDVGGYMSLTYGHNAKGAAYYVDNFSIGGGTDMTPIGSERLVIDDFNQTKNSNLLGGATRTFQDSGPGSRIQATFSDDDAQRQGQSLSLTYDVSAIGSFAGYASDFPELDLRAFQALSLYVKTKGDKEPTNLLVGLRDSRGQERKVAIRRYSTNPIGKEWQLVRIPLAALAGDIDLSHATRIVVAFEAGGEPEATVLIDALAFDPHIGTFVVEDFSSPLDPNRLGGGSWTFAHGAAAVNGTPAKTPSGNGIYGISYGGSIGDVYGYDSGLNYAGWGTSLKGIDCSRCATLSLRIRGARGGEKPNVYLDDGNFRWGLAIADYSKITTDWQEVQIPLSEFAGYGIDLSHLSELQIVFEWENMSGTVYLDEVKIGK